MEGFWRTGQVSWKVFLQGKVSGSEGFATKGFDDASKVLSGRFCIEVKLHGRFLEDKVVGSEKHF